MNLSSSKLVRTAAVASALVAAGANSGDAGNVSVITGFFVTLPSMDLRGPAGSSTLKVPTATWNLGEGLDFTLTGFLPECCTAHEPACFFEASSPSGFSSAHAAFATIGEDTFIAATPLALDFPKTSGQTTLYTVTVQAHCSGLSLSLNFAKFYGNPIGTASYRLTAQ